jgi:hypothetical protein
MSLNERFEINYSSCIKNATMFWKAIVPCIKSNFIAGLIR